MLANKNNEYKMEKQYFETFLKSIYKELDKSNVCIYDIRKFNINGEDKYVWFFIEKQTKKAYHLYALTSGDKRRLLNSILYEIKRANSNEHSDLNLAEIYTEKDYRGNGLGAYGISLIKKVAECQGYSNVYGRISPYVGNDDEMNEEEKAAKIEDLKSFYGKCGFEIKEETIIMRCNQR